VRDVTPFAAAGALSPGACAVSMVSSAQPLPKAGTAGVAAPLGVQRVATPGDGWASEEKRSWLCTDTVAAGVSASKDTVTEEVVVAPGAGVAAPFADDVAAAVRGGCIVIQARTRRK